MKQIVITLLLLLLFPAFVTANLHITEIMHSPTQISDTDGEFIEIYNSGDQEINLSDYTIDNNPFDPITIQPNEYIIIARELLDTDDEDLDSFESFYGNNNGIWDESYQAADGSFTLTQEDTITLTNGIYTEEITYNSSFGGNNGNSIQRLSPNNWEEATPTPGQGNYSTQEPSTGNIEVTLTVLNSPPILNEIIFLTDDSQQPGTQILPNVNLPKEIQLQLNHSNDVTLITLEVNNQTYNLTNYTFEMQPYDLAQNYTVNITLYDSEHCTSQLTSFEYLGILSTTLNTSTLDFNLNTNEQQETVIQVINSGNTIVDVELSGTDLVSNNYNISLENFQVYNEQWLPLSNSPLLNLNLQPNTQEDILLKLIVPTEAQEGEYNGVITITSMESQ